MLKKIPKILSPELLKVLSEMGHGDRLCIGDGNFPGASMAKSGNTIFLRADGHGVPELLDAILEVFPLDSYVETPVMLMEKMDCDKDKEIRSGRNTRRSSPSMTSAARRPSAHMSASSSMTAQRSATASFSPARAPSTRTSFFRRALCFERERSKLMNMRKPAVERLRTFSIQIIGGQAFFRFGSGVSSARSGMSCSRSGRFSISRM